MPWRWHRRGVPTAFGRRTTPHPWPCPPPHDDSRPPLPSHAHAHGPAPSCKDADIGAPIEPAGTGPTSGPGCGLRDRAHARARVAGAGQRGVRCGTRLPKGQPSEHPQLRPCLGEPLPWQPDFGSYAVPLFRRLPSSGTGARVAATAGRTSKNVQPFTRVDPCQYQAKP